MASSSLVSPGHSRLIKDDNGEKILLQPPGSLASAEICLFGAQVTSWKNARGTEMLFFRRKVAFRPRKAFSGGIQMCFPEVSDNGTFQAHGFARNLVWMIDPDSPFTGMNNSGDAYVDLMLIPTKEVLKHWNHVLEFRIRVTLNREGNLALRSHIKNAGYSKTFSFRFAYLTYFNVENIRVGGVERRINAPPKLDGHLFKGAGAEISIILDAVSTHVSKRNFRILEHGLPDAVIWNPWARADDIIFDYKEGQYVGNVACVGPGAFLNPIILAPLQTWISWLELSCPC